MRLSCSVALAILSGFLSVAWTQAAPLCGNGAVEVPELCDDGNTTDGDGCDSNCTPTSCGNGIVTGAEECDDGNTASGDCCSALCRNENHAPDCGNATASVDDIWPPNHKLVSVSIVGVTDPDGDPVTVRATAIAQDEPVDSTGDGTTCPDAFGVGLDNVRLRSERSGGGDGRFYHVAFEAVDRCNAACAGEVTAAVRHDRSPHKIPGDGGPLYDSTLGAPPCEGDDCDPTDCVPDVDHVEPCQDARVPASVTRKLEKAKQVLGGGKGKSGRVAARLLAKAAKRTARAAKTGHLGGSCADALVAALAGGRTCALCSGDE